MKSIKSYLDKLSVIKSFRIKWLIFSILFWTIVDLFILSRWYEHSTYLNEALTIDRGYTTGIWIIVSIPINSIIGLLLFYGINNISEKKYPVIARLLKILIVFTTICLLVIARYLCMILLAKQVTFQHIFDNGWRYIASNNFIADAIFIESLVVLFIQLNYQIGQQYTPGFFLKVMLGRFSAPRNEERIIMFIDLKDSTPISEQLGHQKYFLFIRDFIYLISNAALRNNADIYQYVGDEVIVTWPKLKKNGPKCVNTLILCRNLFFKQLVST
jgi:adenylate cyclase